MDLEYPVGGSRCGENRGAREGIRRTYHKMERTPLSLSSGLEAPSPVSTDDESSESAEGNVAVDFGLNNRDHSTGDGESDGRSDAHDLSTNGEGDIGSRRDGHLRSYLRRVGSMQREALTRIYHGAVENPCQRMAHCEQHLEEQLSHLVRESLLFGDFGS